DVEERLVCVASTGVIGQRLPIDRVTTAMPLLVARLAPTGLGDFARAIMTTDKGPKHAAVQRVIGKHDIRVAGVTKGAGLIAPNMATTLSFLMTDAPVDRVWLRQLLREEVDATLNAVSVDGDTSTNDSCFLLANGIAGGPTLRGDDRAGRALRQMVHE